MASNYIQNGHKLDHTPSGASLTSGQAFALDTLLAVALVDIADGETGGVMVSGVFELPKATADVLTQGAQANWSAANGVQTAAGDLASCVTIAKAAGNGETTVWAMLNHNPGGEDPS